MRPAEVTDDEILAAGRQILARGDEVSGWTIRREVGDRGQAKRMGKIWNEKGDALPPAKTAQDDAEAVSLPAHLQELVEAGKGTLATQIDTIAKAIHRHARMDADATYQRITDQLRAETQRHKDELETADASVWATEAEAVRRGEAITTLENELSEIRLHLASVAEREKLATARADKSDAETAAMESEIQGFARAAQVAAEARAAAEAQTSVMRDEVAHLRVALERSETGRNTEVSRLSGDLTRAQQQIDETRAAHQADAATARQRAADAEAAHREETDRIRQELERRQVEHTRVLADLDAAQRRQVEAETVARESLGRAGETTGRANALEEQLKALLTSGVPAHG